MAERILTRLIAEASVLAGGEHPCETLGHKWKQIGGRACPFHDGDGCGMTSQPVYTCDFCGEIDYGNQPGYPGYEECRGNDFNCGGERCPTNAS